jgi:hypothetical protein
VHAIPEDKLALIKEAVYRGQKIEAIRIYRESAGVGLKEAKEGVEKLEKELRTTRPENFMPQTERRGCLGVIVAAVVIAGLVTAALI